MRGAGPTDECGLAWVARAAEIREMDRRAIEEVGLPGRVLMELAGAGTAQRIMDRLGGRPGRALVLCGRGNNAGDGYVIARHLSDAGWTVRCIAAFDPEGLTGDAAANHALFVALGGEVRRLRDRPPTARMANWLSHADVIVDALFGTGLTRPLEGALVELVEAANEARHALRVAVDIPSGVQADTGAVLGAAFEAHVTMTYGLPKPGQLLHPGAGLTGELQTVAIGLPRSVIEAVGASVRASSDAAAARRLPARPADAHKGTFGHVAVVGGSSGKEGAALLAARGALRGGAGLVTWNHGAGALTTLRPAELMTHPLDQGALDPRSDVLVVGPGLGQDAAALTALKLALASGRALVLDADALNLLASDPTLGVPEAAVLTPHPAEAARLLGCATSDVQSDRLDAALRLVARYRCTVVLKGAASVVASPDRPQVIVPVGDAALATGGTGDVLAGFIGALRAQGLDPHEAAWVGAHLHALAGARLGREVGHAGVLAGEVADALPPVMTELRRGWT